VIGILTIIVNGIFLATLPSQVRTAIDNQVDQLHKGGMREDPAAVQQTEKHLLLINYAITGGALSLGVLFVVFGLIVKRPGGGSCGRSH
jgi:hypothetical protein